MKTKLGSFMGNASKVRQLTRKQGLHLRLYSLRTPKAFKDPEMPSGQGLDMCGGGGEWETFLATALVWFVRYCHES